MDCRPEKQSLSATVGATMSSWDDLRAAALPARLVQIRDTAEISVVGHASVVAVAKGWAATVEGKANANGTA